MCSSLSSRQYAICFCRRLTGQSVDFWSEGAYVVHILIQNACCKAFGLGVNHVFRFQPHARGLFVTALGLYVVSALGQ